MLDSRTGESASSAAQTGEVDVDQPVPGRAEQRSLGADQAGAAPAVGTRSRAPRCRTRHSATRPYAVRLWCETPRCRARGSAPEIRSEPTGRPPRIAAALTASPALTPEKPHRVPVPRLPGPWVTIDQVGVPRASLAASRPECTVTASRSPPNACPTVTVAGQQPGVAELGHRAGEGQRQRALIGHHVDHPGARAVVGHGQQRRGQRGVQVGDQHRQSVQGVGVGQQLVVRRTLLVGPGHHGLQRHVAGLDQVPGRLGRLGGDPTVGVEHGDHQRVPAGAEAAVQRRDIEQHPVADRGRGHQVGVDQRADLGVGCRAGPRSVRPLRASSRGPAVTSPSAQMIMRPTVVPDS